VTPGEYVAGWAKRGPTGRIGNNQPDSASTGAAMLADLLTLKGIRDDLRDPAKAEALLRRRGIDYASYADWRVLDAHEVALGAPQGRPRSRFCAVPEMMGIIRRER
jgi:ferredoxin/flavodoxin---NADP+ reductase